MVVSRSEERGDAGKKVGRETSGLDCVRVV
jgi:hypothetical protein